MCEPTTALVAGTAVLGAYGQYQEGKAARRAGNAQAANLLEQAKQIEEASEFERQQLRESGAQMISQGRTALAGQGADVSFGTPVYWEIGARQEVDADAAMMGTNAERQAQSVRFESSLARSRGRSAQRAATIGAFTSLIGGAARSRMTYNMMKD